MGWPFVTKFLHRAAAPCFRVDVYRNHETPSASRIFEEHRDTTTDSVTWSTTTRPLVALGCARRRTQDRCYNKRLRPHGSAILPDRSSVLFGSPTVPVVLGTASYQSAPSALKRRLPFSQYSYDSPRSIRRHLRDLVLVPDLHAPVHRIAVSFFNPQLDLFVAVLQRSFPNMVLAPPRDSIESSLPRSGVFACVEIRLGPPPLCNITAHKCFALRVVGVPAAAVITISIGYYINPYVPVLPELLRALVGQNLDAGRLFDGNSIIVTP